MAISAKSVALITGASSGIGFELASIFAQHGYNLVLVARNETILNEVANDLRLKYGTSSLVIVRDLSHPKAPEEVYNAVHFNGISIDVLVNNAGFGTYGRFSETDIATQLQMLQVNVTALTHLTRLFLSDMLEQGSGKILNVASLAGFQPGPMMAVYYATKAYVLSFSQALAAELKNTGVTITALCPGPTPTSFQERAGLKSSFLTNRMFVTSVKTVAQAGYDGVMKGKAIVIPGLLNKMIVQVLRLVPRRIPLAIIKFLQEKRG